MSTYCSGQVISIRNPTSRIQHLVMIFSLSRISLQAYVLTLQKLRSRSFMSDAGIMKYREPLKRIS